MRRLCGLKSIGLAGVSALALLTAGAVSAQEAAPLIIGADLDASLSDSDPTDELGAPYDRYTLSLSAGQRIEIEMRSADFDTFLELYGPGEDAIEPVMIDDDGLGGGTDSLLRYTAPSDGTYTLRARAFSEGASGAYTLIARERPPAPPAPEPGVISRGQTVEGAINDGDPVDSDDVAYDAWGFSAAAGERLMVTLTSDDFDAYLQVGRQGAGRVFEELAFNDDDGESLNSRLVFTAPASGDYLIRARPLSVGESGAYTLRLEVAPPPPEVLRLSIGESREGTLGAGSALNDEGFRARHYRFTGREGQRVEIVLQADDFDTYVVLYREQGGTLTRLDENDDASGTNSRLLHTFDASGPYVIEVRGFIQMAEGTYTLRLTEVPPERPPVPLAYGTVVQGGIDNRDPRDDQERGYDSYVFSGIEGNRVQIIARSGDFDTFLRIGAADGEFSALASDDDGLGEGTDSRLNFTLPSTGSYVVRVSPLSSATDGLYSVQLIDRGPAPGPGSILPGATARGTLTEADATSGDGSYFDAYRVNAKGGETLIITMVSNSFDAFVIVGREKSDGGIEVLASDDDGLSDTHARLEWEVPSDGVYVIRAGSFGQGETGAYALTVDRKP